MFVNEMGLIHFCFAVLVEPKSSPKHFIERRLITFIIASPSHEAFRGTPGDSQQKN